MAQSKIIYKIAYHKYNLVRVSRQFLVFCDLDNQKEFFLTILNEASKPQRSPHSKGFNFYGSPILLVSFSGRGQVRKQGKAIGSHGGRRVSRIREIIKELVLALKMFTVDEFDVSFLINTDFLGDHFYCSRTPIFFLIHNKVQ